MRRIIASCIALLLATIASVPATAAPARNVQPAARTPLGNGVGLYPRAIRLEHSGSYNGRIIASVVTFNGNTGLGAIYQSTDAGASFSQLGTVADPQAANGLGLCCSTLFELPQQLGSSPAGTLLWAASMGADTANRRMSIRVWRSTDHGRTWSYLSTAALAGSTGGLWEPEFSVDAQGRLICHFSDETQAGHSQVLTRVLSTDGGATWGPRTNTVASNLSTDRPGMAVVRRLPTGTYFMSYEICAAGGQYSCVVHFRTSADGWDWGDPTYLGIRPETVDGKYFKHAPTIAWSPWGGPNGTILLVGQILYNRDGSVAVGNGQTVFANTEGGGGHWYELPAPVVVNAPYDNYCPNYSSTLVPSPDGTRMLEIATDYVGGVCEAFYGSGSAIGSRTAAGIASGATYRLFSVQSGLCLDVAGGSQAPGGTIQQWTCNNLSPQNWQFNDHGGGYFTLRAQNSGLCLDVPNGSTQPGTGVQQWTCNGASAQDWHVESVGQGYYRLVARNSGLCLDVSGGSPAPGARIQQWTCNNLAPQIWKIGG